MLPGEAAVDRPDLYAGHALGTLHGPFDGPGGFLDVAHNSAPDAATPFHPEPQNLGSRLSRLTGDIRDHCDDFGRPEIQGGDEPLRWGAHAPVHRTMT